MSRNLEYRLYVQRENDFFHEPFKNEQFIYTAITEGNVKAIQENQRKYGNVKSDGKGNLSDDPVRNARYHMIINTAVIARICMLSGLPHETAYTLSDMYIKRADECTTESEISKLNDGMTIEFAQQMKMLSKGKALSRVVRKTLDYICDNLHRNITGAQLAEMAGCSRSYLSVVFKRETGFGISEYIRKKRLETAGNMLRESDFSCSEIASTLCFSSQSHFCTLFKEYYGVTPDKYRKKSGAVNFL